MTAADGRDLPDRSDEDDIPEPLRDALQRLPRERTPPAHAAGQLLAAIDAERMPAPARQRSGRRIVPLAVAAAMMLVVASLLWRRTPEVPANGATPAEATDASAVAAAAEPRARAVADERRNWHAALADTARSARWPRAASAAVDSALMTTDRALAEARAALRRDSTDADAREAIVLMRERQLELLQRARLLLDEL